MDDQQAAKTVFQKETEKWKNLNPDNLAAKLTRQKLFSTFPTIAQDTLLQLEQRISETIWKCSRNRQLKNEVIQEMKDAQKNYCSEEYEELHEATFYRAEASKSSKDSLISIEKAQQIISGYDRVAQFYSGLASLQTSYLRGQWPAVQQRLRTRNIHFAVLNPGLLKIKVTKTTLVTSELSRS
ncbi:hypothetical protein JTB14_009767 [Gonioctena quinquepunctata]|nr:hypothetical protein JTB14_009767 [Gonioctena quinquepunctata]